MRMDAAITFSSALGSRPSTSSDVFFHEAHQRAVADDAGLDAFHQAGAQFAIGQRAEHIDVGKHREGMMKAADKVLALGKIDAGFAADGRIDLREESRGHLHIADSAHEDGSKKPADIAHDAAAKSDQQRTAIAAAADHLAQQPVHALHRLVLFARRQKQRDWRLRQMTRERHRPTAPRSRARSAQRHAAAVFPRCVQCAAPASRAVRCPLSRRILPKVYRLVWFARCFHPNGIKCKSWRFQDRECRLCKLVSMRIGVDFGTTRVVVAAVDRGNFPLVYFETPDGQMRDWFPPVVAAKGSERVYGWEAIAVQDEKDWTLLRSPKRLLRTAGPKTTVKVGDQTIPVQQLMAEMMAALRDAAS